MPGCPKRSSGTKGPRHSPETRLAAAPVDLAPGRARHFRPSPPDGQSRQEMTTEDLERTSQSGFESVLSSITASAAFCLTDAMPIIALSLLE